MSPAGNFASLRMNSTASIFAKPTTWTRALASHELKEPAEKNAKIGLWKLRRIIYPVLADFQSHDAPR